MRRELARIVEVPERVECRQECLEPRIDGGRDRERSGAPPGCGLRLQVARERDAALVDALDADGVEEPRGIGHREDRRPVVLAGALQGRGRSPAGTIVLSRVGNGEEGPPALLPVVELGEVGSLVADIEDAGPWSAAEPLVAGSRDEVGAVIVAVDRQHAPAVRAIDDDHGAGGLRNRSDLFHRQPQAVLEGNLRNEDVLLCPRRKRLLQFHPEQVDERIHAHAEVGGDVDDGQVDAVTVAHGRHRPDARRVLHLGGDDAIARVPVDAVEDDLQSVAGVVAEHDLVRIRAVHRRDLCLQLGDAGRRLDIEIRESIGHVRFPVPGIQALEHVVDDEIVDREQRLRARRSGVHVDVVVRQAKGPSDVIPISFACRVSSDRWNRPQSGGKASVLPFPSIRPGNPRLEQRGCERSSGETLQNSAPAQSSSRIHS